MSSDEETDEATPHDLLVEMLYKLTEDGNRWDLASAWDDDLAGYIYRDARGVQFHVPPPGMGTINVKLISDGEFDEPQTLIPRGAEHAEIFNAIVHLNTSRRLEDRDVVFERAAHLLGLEG